MTEEKEFGDMGDLDEEFGEMGDLDEEFGDDPIPETGSDISSESTGGDDVEVEVEKEDGGAEDESEATAEVPAAGAPKGNGKGKGKKGGSTRPSSMGKKLEKAKMANMTPVEKSVHRMMKKAGVSSLCKVDHLLRHKQGSKVAIKEIALFSEAPEDEVLAQIAKDVPLVNLLHPNAQVDIGRVEKVGADILACERLYDPIVVSETEDDGLQCVSGRHRLSFLAIAYGPDAEIVVYTEPHTRNESRDFATKANQTRTIRARERAEHAAMSSVHGDADASQDAMYESMATTKASIKQYCVYSVLERKTPAELNFTASERKSCNDGGLTTISNLAAFWGAAMNWHKSMERAEFDSQLKDSVAFLNSFADAIRGLPNFDQGQHFTNRPLIAIGKYYRTLMDANATIDDSVIEKLAKFIVGLGDDAASIKQELIYHQIVQSMK